MKMKCGGWLHLAPASGSDISNQGVLRCMRVMMIRPLPIICLISLVLTTPSPLWRCSCSYNGAPPTNQHKSSKPPIPKNKNFLISAHGNSIRALCKYLFKLDENQIAKLEIPTGNPLAININENLEILSCEYLDKERAKDLVVY